MDLFTQYDKVWNERERIYHHFLNEEDSENLDTLRGELLQHLAGNIIVKEHRLRYQKEQYDRYVASLMCSQLKKTNVSLHDFCVTYAYLVEQHISESHMGKCQYVEANYDDFGERAVRPLNATIFYYFFSMDQRKRTVA